MGDEEAARDFPLLQKNGVTHVINCAASLVPNHFPNQLKYASLELIDCPSEDLFSVFYEVIDFIETAIAENGKIFVHCQYGISRSSAVVIAYVMYKRGLDYDSALNLLRRKKPSCDPNAGYAISLINWQQHYLRPPPVNFYAVESLSAHSAQLTAKLKPCPGPFLSLFHPASCTIVQTPQAFLIWLGSAITDSHSHLKDANRVVRLLQKYHSAFSGPLSPSSTASRLIDAPVMAPLPIKVTDSIVELREFLEKINSLHSFDLTLTKE